MVVATSLKAQYTLRYWEASLAWKHISPWCYKWNVGDFMDECRMICCDSGRVGALADSLLSDVVHDIERHPLETPGEVILVDFKTKKDGLKTNPQKKEAVNGT